MSAYQYSRGMKTFKVEAEAKTLYLLGTAGDGPVMEPMLITNKDEMLNAFGDKGSIHEAWTLVNQTPHSCSIIGMKVVGLHSKCFLNWNIVGGEVVEDAIEIASAGASHFYNEVEVVLTSQYIEINAPMSLGGSSNRYLFDEYKIIGHLMRRINYDAENGYGVVYMNTKLDPYLPLVGGLFAVNPSTQRLYGGIDGLDSTKEEMYFALQDAYSMLESFNVDIIVPVGCFLDDIHPRHLMPDGIDFKLSDQWDPTRVYLDCMDGDDICLYHRQLIDFCKKQLQTGATTIGVMGMRPMTNYTTIVQNNPLVLYDYIASTAKGMNVGFQKFDPLNPSGEDSKYISVVCGDLKYPSGHISNGYLTFAAMLASTYENVNLTNEFIPNLELDTNFSSEELNFLDESGFTSFRVSPLKGLVVSNAVSATNRESECHYICNTRMIQLFLSKINEGLQEFIGEPIVSLKKDGMIEDRINDIIVSCKEDGFIKEAKFNIVNYDTLKGTVEINYELKAMHMIESVPAKTGG